MSIVIWCPPVDPSPRRLLSRLILFTVIPTRPIVLLTFFTKSGSQPHHLLAGWPSSEPQLCPLENGNKNPCLARLLRAAGEADGKVCEKSLYGTEEAPGRDGRALSLTGPCGSVPSMVAAAWRQLSRWHWGEWACPECTWPASGP